MTGREKSTESEKAGETAKASETAKELRASQAPKSPETATGQAAQAENQPGSGKAEHFGEAGEGAEEIKDTILEPGKASGAQLEAAEFTVNGSVPYGTVASPSGPVPAGLIADDRMREEALRATQEGRRVRKNSRQRLTAEQLDRMSPAEIRAVAFDRGYEMKEGGRAVSKGAFLKAQAEDESEDLWDPTEESQAGPRAVPIPGVFGGGSAATGPLPAVGGAALTGLQTHPARQDGSATSQPASKPASGGQEGAKK